MSKADIWSTWSLDPLYAIQEQERAKKEIDEALKKLPPDERAKYEEAIELWVTYGGS